MAEKESFLTGNLPHDDVDRCRRLCQGKHGVCSRTGVKHVQLTGRDSSGVNMTRLAQRYPYGHSHSLARCLLPKYMVVPYQP